MHMSWRKMQKCWRKQYNHFYLGPDQELLTVKHSNGQNFGESKHNLEKSCFLLEKKFSHMRKI